MSELRVVVSFPKPAPPVAEQTETLNLLQQAMKAQMGDNERLSRTPELSLPGVIKQADERTLIEREEVALRVFILEFPDGSDAKGALTAVGGWYMRHPHLSVSFKADGPGGGINLRLKNYAAVAYAQLVHQINERLVTPAE